eukprot:14042543-Alexandrium_andersonii.AAC.1
MTPLEHQAEEYPRPGLGSELALLSLIRQRRHEGHAASKAGPDHLCPCRLSQADLPSASWR